jgi:hypothetical protein
MLTKVKHVGWVAVITLVVVAYLAYNQYKQNSAG